MRTVFSIMGVLTLAAVWLTPLPQFAGGAFTSHMTMHMGVVAVASPLIAFGIAGGRFDPVRRIPYLFPPIPASILELVVVWAWHTPVLHLAARQVSGAMAIEQGMFLFTGLFMWLSAFGGDASARPRRAAGVIGLLLTSMHMTLLGALLALGPRPLFHHAGHFGTLSTLDDQHLGGAIMLIVGGIAYLAGGLWLMIELLRAPKLGPERRM